VATSPEVVRAQLAIVTAAAAADLADAAQGSASTALEALSLIVPSYYDAAGSLAVAWYDERRDESNPTTSFTPAIVGDPATDWIEREAAKFAKQLDADLETETGRLVDELARLTEKEVGRGFRETIRGNTLDDIDAIGWSRVARPGACKLCLMAADKGAVYSKASAFFAAHTDCHCAARPEFEGGVHGPEATVEQYLAAKKRRTDRERKALRKYLNENYPDAPG
jgi:hypothetical protein